MEKFKKHQKILIAIVVIGCFFIVTGMSTVGFINDSYPDGSPYSLLVLILKPFLYGIGLLSLMAFIFFMMSFIVPSIFNQSVDQKWNRIMQSSTQLGIKLKEHLDGVHTIFNRQDAALPEGVKRFYAARFKASVPTEVREMVSSTEIDIICKHSKWLLEKMHDEIPIDDNSTIVTELENHLYALKNLTSEEDQTART